MVKQYAEWYKAYFGIDVTSVNEQPSENQPAADSDILQQQQQQQGMATSTSVVISSTCVKTALTASPIVSIKEASATASNTPVAVESVRASVLSSSVNKQSDVAVCAVPPSKQPASPVHNTLTVTTSSSLSGCRVESKGLSGVSTVNSSLLNSPKEPTSLVTSEPKSTAG
jgi:hypothetical protein